MSKHKKTRQEKIIADLRRKLSFVRQPVVEAAVGTRKDVEVVKRTNSLAQTVSYTPSIDVAKSSWFPSREIVSSINSFDYSYVYRDLRKTLALTVLAIGFELVLYSIWR